MEQHWNKPWRKKKLLPSVIGYWVRFVVDSGLTLGSKAELENCQIGLWYSDSPRVGEPDTSLEGFKEATELSATTGLTSALPWAVWEDSRRAACRGNSLPSWWSTARQGACCQKPSEGVSPGRSVCCRWKLLLRRSTRLLNLMQAAFVFVLDWVKVRELERMTWGREGGGGCSCLNAPVDAQETPLVQGNCGRLEFSGWCWAKTLVVGGVGVGLGG